MPIEATIATKLAFGVKLVFKRVFFLSTKVVH
jgi:hypothetical protein